MGLEDLPFIGKKWPSANRTGKLWMLLKYLIAIILAIFTILGGLDRFTSFIVGWHLAERINSAFGGMMPLISYFDVILILSVIVLLIIVAAIMLFLTGRMERRVLKACEETKQWKEEANKPRTVPDETLTRIKVEVGRDYNKKLEKIEKEHAEELTRAKDEVAQSWRNVLDEKTTDITAIAVSEKTKYEKEIAEWAELCEDLKNYLTPVVEEWEINRILFNYSKVTGIARDFLNQRKLLYDNVNQKLKEYKDKKPKN